MRLLLYHDRPSPGGPLLNRIDITILKLSRMIADLAGSDRIEAAHLAEAVQYRPRQVL